VIAERPLLRADASVSHGSVVMSASLLLTALLGAGQALLLVAIAGEGDHTDAFLAAYSLYVVFAILGGSMRASIVPLLGPGEADATFRERATELLSRVLVMGLVVLVALALISVPAGQALTVGLPADARWIAVFTLLVLTPAAFLQIYAAAQAAVLVGARRFTVSALLFVASGAIALGCSAALLEPLGVLGAAIGLLIGAVFLAGGHSAYIRTFQLHPRPRRSMLRDRRQREVAVMLLAAASISVALQLNLAIALASLSGDPGAITAYSYAFFGISLMLAVSSFSIGLVTIPGLVDDFARRGMAAASDYYARVPPYAFAVLVPCLVAFAVDGKPVLDAVFAHILSAPTIDLLFRIALVLGLMAIPAALLFLAGSVMLALGRARRFIAISVASLAIQLALVLPLSSISPVAVAAGHTGTIAITTILLLRSTFGRSWAQTAATAIRRSAPAFALAVVIVLLRLPFGSDPSAAAALCAAVAGAVAYALLAVAFWPGVSRAFVDLLRRPAPS
jgi:peptidoglycan biosynthesis protein MviN/MurJ (putative lipid II flippase)